MCLKLPWKREHSLPLPKFAVVTILSAKKTPQRQRLEFLVTLYFDDPFEHSVEYK